MVGNMNEWQQLVTVSRGSLLYPLNNVRYFPLLVFRFGIRSLLGTLQEL